MDPIFHQQRSVICNPDNPQLGELRDKTDDRLFKIRHYRDIFGNVQHLPLYESPIDPRLLVAATTQALSVASMSNDLDTTPPNYRFNYLLYKALNLYNKLKSPGSRLLAAKEKQHMEAIAVVPQTHESIILSMGNN